MSALKHLIVHMEDPTTDFLCPIYAELQNKTVLRSPLDVAELNRLIEDHDRVIMLGHGGAGGLFSLDFRTTFIISEDNVKALSGKTDSIWIWCHASDFVAKNSLSGFASGMFISEVCEAQFCGIPKDHCNRKAIEHSNELFVSLVAHTIHLSRPDMLRHVRRGYRGSCPIIKYNRERLRVLIAEG